MALFRKFFYKKPPDGLLEISEKVYVFDYCFTMDVMDQEEYKVYINGIIERLRDHFPDASYMVFNMREGDNQSQISSILCDYDMTVMDYPRQYEGCPLLTMEMIHHFLRSGENWLQLGLQNIILMHCERGGWLVLAFMLAALLIYRKQFTGEQKTLDMIYRQGSQELLQLMSPLNPLPSQLRYLQYISRRNVGSEWPPLDRALTLDCIIIRLIPNMDGEGGCRPIFRIYGQDPFMAADRTPKVLFSTPKKSKLVRYYKQDDCELVKIDINCHVQGDVVLECITLDNDLEREKMMFRVMFNTAFIRSNILMLNRDEIDMLWDIKEQFPKNFRVEILFSDMEAASSVISIDLPRIDEKEGLPIEAFAKVKEIFSNVEWLDSKPEVANVLQQITASNILLERLDGGASAATSSMLKEPLPGRLKFDSKTRNNMQSLDFPVQGKPSMSSFESSGDDHMEKKLETSESMALPENNIQTLAHMAHGNQPIHSLGLSVDSDSTKKEIEPLESKESLAQGKQPTLLVEPSMKESSEKDIMVPTSTAQGEQSTPLVEPYMKESLKNETKLPTFTAQGKQSTPLIEPSMKESSVRDTKVPTFAAQGEQSTPLVEPPMKESLKNDTRLPTSTAQGEQSTRLMELSMKESSEKDTKSPTYMTQKEQSTPLVEPSMKESWENDTKLPKSMAQGKPSTPLVEPFVKESSENKTKFPTSMAQGEQSTPLAEPSKKELSEKETKIPISKVQGEQSTAEFEASMNANSVTKTFGSLESKEKDNESSQSKTLLENDTMHPASVAQGKHSISIIEPSTDANSARLEPNKKDTESLDSKALSENDARRATLAVQGKLSTPSFESVDASTQKKIDLLESNVVAKSNIKTLAPMDRVTQPSPSFESYVEKKIDSLESSAVPESNNKTLAPIDQPTQPIPSFGLSTDSSFTTTQVESSETKALVENDNKYPTSMAQEKQQYIQLIEPSMNANSMEKKVGPLESKESDIQSLESKALLGNNAKFPTSMAQEKQSIPLIETSADANSMEKKTTPLESKQRDIESLESKALFKTKTKGAMSTDQREPSMDENSMLKKVGESESTASSETDTKSVTSRDQMKQHSPLLEPPIDEGSIKVQTELQELKVGLQLQAQSKIISPRVHHALRSTQISFNNSSPGSPGAISRFQSASSALGITSVLQDHAPMDAKEEETHAVKSPPSGAMSPSDSKVLKSAEPSSGGVPPASPQTLLPSSPLKPSVDAVAVIEKIAPTTASPRPPPPLPTPPGYEPNANLMQPTVTQYPESTMPDRGQKSLAPPPPPPPPPSPPSSTGQIIPSSITPPPPASGLRPSAATPLSPQLSLNKSAPPPPPPPPPSSTAQTSSSSIPPPPPLSGLPSSAASPISSQASMNKSAAVSGPPPPPPPPIPSSATPGPTTASLAPPPPPPPFSASKSSLPNSGPPIPPPPLPSASANGLFKPGSTPLQSNANVPPVPGLPGGKGRGLLRANPRSQAQTKRSTLKPYHWLKLTRVMQGSLWAETQKLDEVSRAPEFDMSELENLFSAAPNSDNGKGGKSDRRSGQKVEKVQLIELRRAYNCEIMLSKVKIPLPDLVSCVLALDESVLDIDQVENLIKFCPTKEEMEQLKNYTGDTENLGKCEKFFLEQMKVPRVESKLRVFSFKLQFTAQVKELRRDLNIVNNASEEIRNSDKLKRIMQTILSLGNALNHGTARGSAIGFRLDSLLKLTDTRSRNSKMTLMHYLCKVLSEKLPELLEFPQDLVNLEASTKIQLKYLAEEMQAVSKGLEKVVQELTASENDGPVSENFCQILKEFLSHAEAEVRCLAQLYANVGRNADALALYFGEDPARVPFEQVVSTLLNFVRMFVKAHEENCKQIEFEKKKAEKEAENEKLKLKESENMMRTTIKSGNIK